MYVVKESISPIYTVFVRFILKFDLKNLLSLYSDNLKDKQKSSGLRQSSMLFSEILFLKFTVKLINYFIPIAKSHFWIFLSIIFIANFYAF